MRYLCVYTGLLLRFMLPKISDAGYGRSSSFTPWVTWSTAIARVAPKTAFGPSIPIEYLRAVGKTSKALSSPPDKIPLIRLKAHTG